MSSERSFFQAMEEFGFFSHIYEKLPPEFTAVFEIARVLEDEDNALAQQLRQVLKLPSPVGTGKREEVKDFHIYAPPSERFVADLIRSPHDVSRIYPQQFILPDELFMQRLAQRELWMPVSRSTQILPVDEVDRGFSFDSKKQKVYILFDTSQSMVSHHRIHLAKAIVYYFLKKNKSELGHISLRTFDDQVGELHTAVDASSYDALMRYILRISHLGEGTVLQKALLQALDDFQTMEHLSGAEILIITDGAVSLDEEAIRAKMDDQIQINSIKIGHAQIFASDAQMNDMITYGKVKDQQLFDLLHQEEQTLYNLKGTTAPHKHQELENLLSGIRRQIQHRKQELGKTVFGAYGHEIERLSTVYVNLDDFNETDRFRADDETIADLEALAFALEEEASEFLTPDLTKKLAILHDHISFLQKYETDQALKDRLQKIDDHLRKMLSRFMGEPLEGVPNGEQIEGAASQAVHMPLSEDDMRDLQFLLDADLSMDGNWGKLLKWMWMRAVRVVSKWRKRG